MKFRKLSLLLVLILFIVVNYSECAIISAIPKKPRVINLNYIIDQKTNEIIFSPKRLDIDIGQIIRLKTNDLLIGGELLEFLDIDWEDHLIGSYYYTFYYMRGINLGTFEIEAIYTKDSTIRGKIEVSVKGKSQHLKNVDQLMKIYYSINSNEANSEKNESIKFFPRKVKLRRGQRIIFVPKNNTSYQNLLIELDNSNILSEVNVFNAKGDQILFKAITTGKVELKCQIAHAYFIKGTISVEVIN